MRRVLGTTLALTVAFACLSGVARGDTIEPTRFDDPAPNGCKPNNCSLREAVRKANSNGDPKDKIKLRKGKYKLTIPEALGDPNDASGGDLDMNGEYRLIGKGARKTTVSGTNQTRVFHPQGTFNGYAFRKLTIAKGAAGGDDGGAIYAGNVGGEVKLSNTVIKKNSGADGGAIYSAALVIIDRTTVFGNLATGSGGALFLPAVSGANPAGAFIRRSTISENDVAGLGGGIALDGFDAGGFPAEPFAEIDNSTVGLNTAAVSGGGISAIQGSQVTVDNTTIAQNRSDQDDSGGGPGGGIYQSSGAVFSLDDSILANNSHGSTASDHQCSGTFTGTANVITAAPGCASFPAGPNGIVASEIVQLDLANNGGPTKTYAIEGFSAANGFALTCPPRDQRGVKRDPDDCDSGSFELRE